MLSDTVRRSDRPELTEARPAAGPSPGLVEAGGDAIALAYLAVVLVVTVLFDGGLDAGGSLILGGTALLTVPVAYAETIRSSRWGRAVLLTWGLGLVLALAFAVHRADMTEATLTYSLPPIAFMTARRLHRRSWGPAALLALLAASAVAYWGQALSLWLGPPLEQMRSNWLSVFWHNPTGALMGSFGIIALVLAIRMRGLWSAASAGASALLLAGLWLTGSRGALIATALGIGAAVVASRDIGWRRLATVSAGVLVGTALAATLLLQVGGIRAGTASDREPAASPERETTDLVRIEATAERNLRARFAHMDAALDLFSQHPVTGAGMGAYGELGNSLASPGANLTLSAHNEFVEVLAEGGLLFGLPFLAAGIGIGVLALRRVLLPQTSGQATAALSAGAIGVAVLLLVHTAVDIDWRYPVIPGLLAVAAAILVPAQPRPHDGRWTHGTVIVPVVIALVIGTLAAGTESWARTARAADDSVLPLPAPAWDVYRRTDAARMLARDGELTEASEVLRPAERWNARSPGLDVMRAVISYRADDIDADGLIGTLHGQRTGAPTYVWAAEALLDGGEVRRADRVIEAGLELSREHAGTPYAHMELWGLKVRHAAHDGDCPRAEDLVSVALEDQRLGHRLDQARDHLTEVLEEACPGA